MEEWSVFVAGAFFLVTLATAMARLGAGLGGQAWSAAWACLWMAGLASVFSSQYPSIRPLAPIFGTAFGFLLLRGASLYTGRWADQKPKLAAIAAAVALARIAIDTALPGADEIMGALSTTTAVGVCCWLFVRPDGRDSTPWEWVLASLFPSIAVVSWYYALQNNTGEPDTASIFAWLNVGVIVASVKTGAFVALSRDRLAQLHARAEDSEAERNRLLDHFHAISENASDLIAEIDGRGRIAYANPAFLDVLGMKPEPLRGRPAADLLYSSETFQIGDEVPGPPIEPQIVQVRHANGRLVTIEANLRRFRHSQGGIGLVATARDVTDRTERERRDSRAQEALQVAVDEKTSELQLSLAELERSQRLASLGTMAAGIAHQINNPIGSIQLASEFALGAPEEEREAAWAEALGNSVEQARRCGRIVSSMLQFARNESMAKTPEDLGAVLRRACQQIEQDVSTKASVDTSGIEWPLPILASAIELEQAILNVLRNASESSDDVVHIVAAARCVGDVAVATISDDGRGMPPEEIEHAFDPFYTTRLRRGGTGLGLSVAHSIVTDHAGHITVESEVGVGTTITITVPARDTRAGGATTSR